FPFSGERSGGAASTSNELRLNSLGSGPLRWVAGAYTFHEAIDNRNTFRTYITSPFGSSTTIVPYLQHIENQSKALFGQAIYSLTGDTRVTLGLRRTLDEKAGSDPLAGKPAPAGATQSPAAYATEVKFSNTSWKLGIDHDL